MNILRVFLIALCVLLFIILFCPIRIKLLYKDEVTLYVGYLFPFIKLIPMKKSDKPKKEKKKKQEKQKKETEEKTAEKRKNPLKDFIDKNGLSGLIDIVKSLASIVLKLAKTVSSHIVVSEFTLTAVIVGEDSADTAMKFAYANAAIFPSAAVIDKNIKKFRRDIHLIPGFDKKETEISLKMKAGIIPVFIIIAAAAAAVKALILLLRSK